MCVCTSTYVKLRMYVIVCRYAHIHTCTMNIFDGTGLTIGLYGVVFHEEVDGHLYKYVDPFKRCVLTFVSSFSVIVGIFVVF